MTLLAKHITAAIHLDDFTRATLTPILLIPGNVKPVPFVNCVVAATEQLRQEVGNQNARFERIHILQTHQSFAAFAGSTNINDLLREHDLRQSDFIHHTVDLAEDADQRLGELLRGVMEITGDRPASNFYVDLTGGVTQIKVALGILAYLIGTENVYTLEIDFQTGEQREWTIKDIRSSGLTVNYRRVAGLGSFDEFGRSNLTIVNRIRSELEALRENLMTRFPERSLEIQHAVTLLERAERFGIRGPQESEDGNAAGTEGVAAQSVLFHATAAAEGIVDIVLREKASESQGLMLGQKLRKLREIADARSPYSIDTATFEHMTHLLSRLRNRAAHWSDATSNAGTLPMQADLGLRLSRSFIWILTETFDSFLDDRGNIVDLSVYDEPLDDKNWFVGIDGDGTGGFMKAAFQDHIDCGPEIRDHSNKISNAIKLLRKKVNEKCGEKSIIFAAGDNMLFVGKVSKDFIKSLLRLYEENTGLTASAGVGLTPYQASVALSLAKGEQPGCVRIVTLSREGNWLS